MICEQKELFRSLSDWDKYKHYMDWEGVTYEGYCRALDNPEDYKYPIPDFVFEIEHQLHNATYCTFVACNCDETCEHKRESKLQKKLIEEQNDNPNSVFLYRL